MSDEGASNNERMLAAAKQDNDELILEIFEKEGSFNINFRDGLGNTALHYAAANASLDVLEHILEQDECDVDLQNRIEGHTPLHLAVRIPDKDERQAVVESLLDAGADPRVKDKHGQRPIDSVPFTDTELRDLFRRAEAVASVNQADIANDSDGEPGSGSGSEED
ncbi:ankyrin [Ceratobasidium sp. AG-I]|nr:ankyrin [Ceratobasidium sp. AG-I]